MGDADTPELMRTSWGRYGMEFVPGYRVQHDLQDFESHIHTQTRSLREIGPGQLNAVILQS